MVMMILLQSDGAKRGVNFNFLQENYGRAFAEIVRRQERKPREKIYERTSPLKTQRYGPLADNLVRQLLVLAATTLCGLLKQLLHGTVVLYSKIL